MNEALTLYSYWRSSAAYRVRIGLNLKGLDYNLEPVHLVRDGGEQHSDAYQALNPQHLVPTLLHGERRLTQSLAILEYIDECWPKPALLPADCAWTLAVDSAECTVECGFRLIPEFGGEAGGGDVFFAQASRGDVHAPTSEVGDRRFADERGETGAE